MSLSNVYKKCLNGVVSIGSGSGNASAVSSGFFIDPYHIVTCSHCVYDTIGIKNNVVKVYIDTIGSTIVDADVLGTDGTSDIAILRVKKIIPGVVPLKWAISKPQIGDQAVAIGTPFGDIQSVSNAYIRDISFYGSNLLPTVCESILIDGSAIGGNSGGPLLNMNGEVIGIISYGYTAVTGGTMNGAVPSWIASLIASWIISNKKNYVFGSLGIKVSPMYIDDAIYLGMNRVQGYMIIDTLAGFNTGLKEGDIITYVTIAGKTYEVGQLNSQTCIYSLIHFNPNKSITLTVKRGGEDMKLTFIVKAATSTRPQNGIL